MKLFFGRSKVGSSIFAGGRWSVEEVVHREFDRPRFALVGHRHILVGGVDGGAGRSERQRGPVRGEADPVELWRDDHAEEAHCHARAPVLQIRLVLVQGDGGFLVEGKDEEFVVEIGGTTPPEDEAEFDSAPLPVEHPVEAHPL